MKILRILACALLLCSWAWAQNPNGSPPEVTVSQLNIPLGTSVPPVTQANVAIVGNPGTATYRYWLVANYTFGQSILSKSFKITNAPTVLTGSNYVTITPAYPAGATSVDLLRTTSDTPPSGTGNYAVSTGNTSGAISDTGAGLTSYTVNPANPSQFTLCLNNVVTAAGTSHLILGQGTPTNCGFVKDLTTGGTSPIYTLEVAGTPLTAGDTVNFNATLPAAPTNALNVIFQTSNSGLTDSVSAYILGNGNVADCLSGVATWVSCGGAGGTPAGSDTQLQFNKTGAFGAQSSLTYNYSTDLLTNTAAGVFTNTQMNEYVLSTAGTISPSSLFYSAQGSNYATEAVTGAVGLPSGTTAHQGNGLAGYATSATNSSARSVANAVGVYGQGEPLVNGAAAWGGNVLCQDSSSLTGINCTGFEVDTNVFGNETSGWVQGIVSSIFGTGTMPTCGGCSFGMSVVSSSPSTIHWPSGYYLGVGAVASTGAGLWLDHLYSTGGAVSSPPIWFSGYDGTTSHTASLQATSAGVLQLNGSNICTVASGCTGGGGGVSGSGTAGTLPEWTGSGTSTSLGNSPIVDGGSTGITVTVPSTGTFNTNLGSGNAQFLLGAVNDQSAYLGAFPYTSIASTGNGYLLTEGGTNGTAELVASGSANSSEVVVAGQNSLGAGAEGWQVKDTLGNYIASVASGSVSHGAGLNLGVPSGNAIIFYQNGSNFASFNSTVATLPSLILSNLTASTSPVCPNGTSGALTTSGCTGGGSGYTLQVAGTSLTAGDTVNFNGTLPAAISNSINVIFQTSKSGSTDSVSAYLLGDGNAAHCLLGTGAFGTCPSSSVPLTTLGDMLYENATPAPARLPGNTSTTMAGLTQTGTGSISAAPGWTLYVGGGASPLSATVSGSLAQSQIFVVNSSGNVVNAYSGINVDPQTGNYTFACPADRLGEVEFPITAPSTFSLPQAGSSACTGSNMSLVVRNPSTSTAILTITATTSTFQPEGGNSITVNPGAGVFIYSDATSGTGNYHDLPIAKSYGGVNVQTSAYTLTALDKDKMVVMNCTVACAATLPATPPTSNWNARILSIGSTLATVSLNSLNFNGAATAPTLVTGHVIAVATDGSNYFGDITSGGSGANTALSNLASVSINTSLIPQTAVDLGSQTDPFRTLYLYGTGTYGTDSFSVTGAPTANRTVTLPDNSGTVDELNLAATFTAAKTFTNSDLLLLGSSTGATTVTSANSSATNYTLTVPANSGTLAEVNLAQTFSATQTLTGHIIMSGHDVALPLVCADTSGSGTAQSCTTSPSFTPAAGDHIIYTTTTANTGTGLTINVNSLGAKSVAKWQTTTTLAANDVRANTEILLKYDGTNWEMDAIGNAPSGGSSSYTIMGSNAANYSVSPEYVNFPNGIAGATTTAATAASIISTAQTIDTLYVHLDVATAASSSVTYTLYYGATTGAMAATTLTCTVAASSTDCSDLTHSFTVVAGGYLSLQITYTGTPGSTAGNTVSVRAH